MKDLAEDAGQGYIPPSNPEPIFENIPPPGAYKEVDIGGEIHGNTASAPEQFNPDIHAVDENGNPRRNKDGSFAKKRGRKPGGEETVVEPVPGEVMRDFNQPAPLSTIQMVQMMLGLTTILSTKYFGPEWNPTADEAKMLTDVWSRYVHYKGWDEKATPELIVTMVTIGFLMPRVTSENFKNKILRRREDAHANNRATGNGENNTGQNNSAASGNQGPESLNTRPIIERMGESVSFRTNN